MLKPLPHDVVWDADLAAASAQVVGSILEWPGREPTDGVADTLARIAHFFRVKNAEAPSKGAAKASLVFDNAATALSAGDTVRSGAAKALLERARAGMEYRGDPVEDWRAARSVLDGVGPVKGVSKAVRMVRLFQASDALGTGLSGLWSDRGSYAGAAELIRRTLDQERSISQERDARGCVLMTMHKAKGKEFDGVVIVEGQYASSLFSEKYEDPPFERSRRLLRLGITRARSLVTILRPRDARLLVG